jgi:hypothetical protein
LGDCGLDDVVVGASVNGPVVAQERAQRRVQYLSLWEPDVLGRQPSVLCQIVRQPTRVPSSRRNGPGRYLAIDAPSK